MREIRPSGSEGGVTLTPSSLPLSTALVGMARCAVRAACSGAAIPRAAGRRFRVPRGDDSARYFAGGNIAARCPYQVHGQAWLAEQVSDAQRARVQVGVAISIRSRVL